MTNKLFTKEITTGDITLTSNVTSVTARANRISRVEEKQDDPRKNPAAIYVDLTVDHPEKFHYVLEATEAVDLALGLNDAVEMGLLMVAMGLEHKTDAQIKQVLDRLADLIEQYR